MHLDWDQSHRNIRRRTTTHCFKHHDHNHHHHHQQQCAHGGPNLETKILEEFEDRYGAGVVSVHLAKLVEQEPNFLFGNADVVKHFLKPQQVLLHPEILDRLHLVAPVHPRRFREEHAHPCSWGRSGRWNLWNLNGALLVVKFGTTTTTTATACGNLERTFDLLWKCFFLRRLWPSCHCPSGGITHSKIVKKKISGACNDWSNSTWTLA